jgi:hypothetical protein
MAPAMDEFDRIERRLKLHDIRVLMSVVEIGSMNKASINWRCEVPSWSFAG